MNKEHKWILEEKYNGIQTKEFKKDIERLEKGEPVAYIIGNKTFLNCVIDLSKKPLIPREETEFWVEKEINKIDKTRKIKCLDLFSGSGCIGIAILKHIKNSSVDFGEIDSKFIEQIEYNLNLNNIDESRTKVIKSDVFENIKDKYDYIFANPPYISINKLESVQKSVIDFEPKKALFANDDGLFFIKKLIDEGFDFLNTEGEMFIEFDSWQKPFIEKLLKSSKFIKNDFIKDQYEKWRILRVTRVSK